LRHRIAWWHRVVRILRRSIPIRPHALGTVGLLVPLLLGCQGAAPRDLQALVVADSSYLDPETGEPHSGPVFRSFPSDPDRRQLEGRLEGGTWEGELTVYHETGRIRYQGEMANGVQCGGWIQIEEDTPPEDPWEAIKEELESIVMYPACPDG